MEEAWELAVVSEAPSIKGAVSSEGGELEARGEWVERLGNSLSDFISPATELSGLVGTSIRAVRYEVAIRSALRAKRISEDNGLAVNPVSLKFLIPWAEGASLEPEADGLSEQWSKLLSSEANEADFNSIVYIDILRKLQPQHVQFLSNITANLTAEELAEPAGTLHENTLSYEVLEALGYSENLDLADELDQRDMPVRIEDSFTDLPGSILSWATVFPSNQDNSIVGVRTLAEYAKPSAMLPDSSIVAPLEALGIIKSVLHNLFDERGQFEVRYHAFMLTGFGFGFIRRCIA